MKNLQASQFRDILEELNSLKGRHEQLNERQEALYKMLENMKGPPPEGNCCCLLYRKIAVDLIEISEHKKCKGKKIFFEVFCSYFLYFILYFCILPVMLVTTKCVFVKLCKINIFLVHYFLRYFLFPLICCMVERSLNGRFRFA